jgi:Zn-dependent protease with chaperone function
MILGGAALSVVGSVLLALTARPIARRLPPKTAVPLLASAAVAIACATAFGLAVIAWTVAGTHAEVAALGNWSAPLIEHLAGIPSEVGITAALVLVVLFACAVLRFARDVQALWEAEVSCRQLGAGVDGLIIVDDDAPVAFALNGLRGRIVVSRGLLAVLTPAERRVVLAHERSHLAHRHSVVTQVVAVAAALNPLLTPVVTTVREAVERWADEDAAAAVGDRDLAARALARAAAAINASPMRRLAPAGTLAMTELSVTTRTAALLASPPRPRRTLVLTVVVYTVAAVAGAVASERGADRIFDRAGGATYVPVSTTSSVVGLRHEGPRDTQPRWSLLSLAGSSTHVTPIAMGGDEHRDAERPR